MNTGLSEKSEAMNESRVLDGLKEQNERETRSVTIFTIQYTFLSPFPSFSQA